MEILEEEERDEEEKMNKTCNKEERVEKKMIQEEESLTEGKKFRIQMHVISGTHFCEIRTSALSRFYDDGKKEWRKVEFQSVPDCHSELVKR